MMAFMAILMGLRLLLYIIFEVKVRPLHSLPEIVSNPMLADAKFWLTSLPGGFAWTKSDNWASWNTKTRRTIIWCSGETLYSDITLGIC